MERRRLELDDRRLTTVETLEDIPGVEVDGTPTGAFLLADVSATYGKLHGDRVIDSAADFAELLLMKANVAVVPSADFADPNHLRISYTVPPDCLREALTRFAAFVERIPCEAV